MYVLITASISSIFLFFFCKIPFHSLASVTGEVLRHALHHQVHIRQGAGHIVAMETVIHKLGRDNGLCWIGTSFLSEEGGQVEGSWQRCAQCLIGVQVIESICHACRRWRVRGE